MTQLPGSGWYSACVRLPCRSARFGGVRTKLNRQSLMTKALDAVKRAALWFESAEDGLGPVLDAIGGADAVLIGEATHGTDEFYRIRAELTKALVTRKGFNVVAVEADWPDAYRVNRWIRHASTDHDADTALADFTRFPRWMWRNTAVVDFITWLRGHNA